jgi:hypothetical protein
MKVLRLTENNKVVIPYVSPEDKIRREQERIEETKALVEAKKQQLRSERESRQKQAAILEQMSIEQRKQQIDALIQRQTVGMDKSQIEAYKRLMELEPLLESNSGDKREEVRAEWAILQRRMVEHGRTVGSVTFIPQTIWVSTSGHGLVDPQGKYHQGVLGAYETTSWLLKQDPETKEFYLGRMGVIEKTNIMIEDRLAVNLTDKLPEPVPNKPQPELFSKKQELPEARPLTTQEFKKRMGLSF